MYARKVAKNFRRMYAGTAAGTTQVCMQEYSMKTEARN